MDLWSDRQLVEVLEDRRDVLSGTGAGEEAGGGSLDILQFIEGFGGDALEYAVTVV